MLASASKSLRSITRWFWSGKSALVIVLEFVETNPADLFSNLANSCSKSRYSLEGEFYNQVSHLKKK
ncbi:hypothetical protein [Companilactobacillus futsaii]|uniref:hypothetical protein n=1 Tax=Companilactobacillus futsaii TaxID=938155 RepID=UPI001F3C9847|nr:hypothetical protein [Companilactobacillus futsaii]